MTDMDIDQEQVAPVMQVSSPTSSTGSSDDQPYHPTHATQQARGKRLSANKPGLTLNLSAPPARWGFGEAAGAASPRTPSYQMATTPNAPPPVTNVLSDHNRQNQDRLHAHWANNSQAWNLDSPALAGAHPTYSPWEGPPPSFQTPSTPTTSQPNGRSTSPVTHMNSSSNSSSAGSGHHGHSHGHGSNTGWRKGHASRASRELSEMTTNAMAVSTPTNPYFGQNPFGLQSAGFSLQRPGSTGTVRGQ